MSAVPEAAAVWAQQKFENEASIYRNEVNKTRNS
jgi:hypothetical protein